MRVAELHEAVELYLAKGGKIKTLQGFSAPSPLPARRAWIDTDTKLNRNDRYIRPMHTKMLSTHERKRLRAMAAEL